MNLPANFKFLDFKPGASTEALATLRKKISVKLPDDLIHWLRERNGGMPARENYFIPRNRIKGCPCSIGIEQLLSAEKIAETFDEHEGLLPQDFIPFGDDGDGNFVLIGQLGEVAFWDYRGRISHVVDSYVDEYTLVIAKSLLLFFSMLGEGPLSVKEE